MNFTFRKVITGIQLSAKEVEVLREAENILIEADKELCDLEVDTEIDEELRELVRTMCTKIGLLVVRTTVKEDEE